MVCCVDPKGTRGAGNYLIAELNIIRSIKTWLNVLMGYVKHLNVLLTFFFILLFIFKIDSYKNLS